MKRELIHVDQNGLDEDGNDFELAATPEAIAAGMMVNVPVTLIFPDGRKFDTMKAMVTPKGMAEMKKMIGGAA